MILVDTSIWIDHFRSSDAELKELLSSGQVLIHSFIIGELSLGNLHKRDVILGLLSDLPKAIAASDDEAFTFIGSNKLYGLGIGFVDAHLLASARLTATRLWTRDKKLNEAAKKLGCAYIFH
ncbi:MAG: PIN domain-containing protein [Rickettsiales bacterium]|jgi:predicted nucleic acid-binding protein